MSQKKLAFGAQIIAFLLLIQLAHSWQAWTETKDMFELQGIIEKSFVGTCKADSDQYKKSVQYIASLPQAGFWNLNNHPITDNGNSIQSMTFETVKVQGQFEFPNAAFNGLRQVTGLLATPNMPGPLKGIVIYFHGTFFSKNEAPSSQTYPIYKGVASIFGAKKYAVLFPDYLGYGADEDNVHPYVLYPEQNILTATYLLNLVAPILNKKFGNVNEANPLPLMSTGYSEGGAYGVFFGACNSPSYNNRLTQCSKVLLSKAYKIVAISGSEGAYDPSGVVKDFLLQQVPVKKNNNPFRAVEQVIVNLGKPGLSALAIYSYATYNPNYLELQNVLQSKYYKMDATKLAFVDQDLCNIDGQHLNIQQALSLKSTKNGSSSIVKAIFFSAVGKRNNGQVYLLTSVGALEGTQNSILALVNKDALLTSTFDESLKNATVVDYGNYAPYPVFVFSLDYDSMVSPLNTQNFVKNNVTGNVHSYIMDNERFKTCNLFTGGPTRVDHIGAYIVSHVFVLNFFEKIVNGIKSTAEDL